ncbi:hypothetical protein ACFYP4_02535 [Streptomyces sp. NPDC005551]|uniref:hypothetical protein n=1 Tax=Streptomyces sp. NPDC005551 TaxID=3364725 RepID=UPI0036BB4BEF
MRTIDFLGLYVGFIRLNPRSPLFHRFEVSEYEGKCRTSRATFIRLFPFNAAVVVGRWHKSGLSQLEMVEQLMAARNIDLYDEEGSLDPRFEQRARQKIADQATDPDDEWTILEMVGLAE